MADVRPRVGRQFTILFVEDDSALRDVVAEALAANFRVHVASDGYEAIRLLVDHHVDVLLTDVMMPGLSGADLAAQAKLLRPHIRVVYTTGYADQINPDALRFGKLLEKPIRPDRLVTEIEGVLAA